MNGIYSEKILLLIFLDCVFSPPHLAVLLLSFFVFAYFTQRFSWLFFLLVYPPLPALADRVSFMTNCFVSRFSPGYYFYRHCDHVSPSRYLCIFSSSPPDSFRFSRGFGKLAKVNFSRHLCKAIAINLSLRAFRAMALLALHYLESLRLWK